MTAMLEPLPTAVLPAGVRARRLDNGNGLDVHLLEAGWESPGRPLLLLLHGFPELAFSWRSVMPALAQAGYHVVAPDQRGYGRTLGWIADYDGDLRPYRMINLVRDALGLVWALGRREVAAVVGHDFGSMVAGWCAVVRPDVFRRVVMMSAPFAGPPPMPVIGEDATDRAAGDGRGAARPLASKAADIHSALAALARPRKHYQWYYSTRAANEDMWRCPQGLRDFLRAYFHMKSADWRENRPYRLSGWDADSLAAMPTYYIMDLERNMAQTVAGELPSAASIVANTWLPESAMDVYVDEYRRTGFQGGLQWYRCQTGTRFLAESQLFAGRSIDVPAMFVAGESDWGIYQKPGDLEHLQGALARDWRGTIIVPGAGHWVQQEQPAAVVGHLLGFLAETR
ncbi:MAG: alpha/beta fold hydrolase [Burkholderiaceae bacterium]